MEKTPSLETSTRSSSQDIPRGLRYQKVRCLHHNSMQRNSVAFQNMILYEEHTPSISAKSETGRSPLVGRSRPIQNICVYHIYVSEGRTFYPQAENALCSGKKTTCYGFRKICLSKLQCNFTGTDISIILSGAVCR